MQACVGLECAHDKGIVHRDIKPGNIFLTIPSHGHDSVREVRILDFGIARLGVGSDVVDITELTRTGSMLGSPQYMAREQARGSKDIDQRADIWSLGIVLYRLLTGVCPHQKEADSALGELLLALCCRAAPSIQERAPWVLAALAHVVHRALSIERQERFADARAMREALVGLLPDASYAIDTSMLVPLAESARQVVAPRAVLPVRRTSITDDNEAALASSNTLSATPLPPTKSRRFLLMTGAFALVFAASTTLVVSRFVASRSPKGADATPSVAVAAPRPEPAALPAA